MEDSGAAGEEEKSTETGIKSWGQVRAIGDHAMEGMKGE
jgi:hypothetical protein